MPASCPSRPHHRSPTRLTLAVQNTGRLLCWSLAAGMTTAAIEALLAPPAGWWHTPWPLPWYLTCLSIPAWSILRIYEKTTQRPPGLDTAPDHYEQAA
jgi:hypothetical protein